MIHDDGSRSCDEHCPNYEHEDEEMCIGGRMGGGEMRSQDAGPCLCYCHSQDQEEALDE